MAISPRNDITISIRRLNVQIGVQHASFIHLFIWCYKPGVLNFLFEYPVPPRPIPRRRLAPANAGGPPELGKLSIRIFSEDDELGGVDTTTGVATVTGEVEVEGRDTVVGVEVAGPAEGRV